MGASFSIVITQNGQLIDPSLHWMRQSHSVEHDDDEESVTSEATTTSNTGNMIDTDIIRSKLEEILETLNQEICYLEKIEDNNAENYPEPNTFRVIEKDGKKAVVANI